MDAFPAFFPLKGRRVVVAGTGEAAEAKARLFEGSPADLARLEGDAALAAAAYAGAALIFIAGADERWLLAAVAVARTANAPINVVDRPDLCDFTTPAVIDRGEVVAAIGTGGASPMLATLLRQDIEARVPQGAGRVAALFRTLQDEIRSALPDVAARRAFLSSALTGPAADAAMSGDMDRATTMLRAALRSGGAASGQVQYLDASGPADLLTLRAVRALAAADVLVCDPAANPEILTLARREAERKVGLSAEEINALAAGGMRVLRLTTAPAEAEQAKITFTREVLPTVAS